MFTKFKFALDDITVFSFDLRLLLDVEAEVDPPVLQGVTFCYLVQVIDNVTPVGGDGVRVERRWTVPPSCYISS